MEMTQETQEWIDQFNKKCAEFLGETSTYPLWKSPSYTEGKFWVSQKFQRLEDPDGNDLISPSEMKFHSDWNWIHEVIDKIEQTVYNVRKSDGAEHKFYVWFRKNHCEIWPVWINKEPLKVNANSKKEAVIQAINKFIDWYNKQKES